MKVAIYGSGDLGIQMNFHLKNAGIEVVGFIDDTKEKNSIICDSLKVLGGKSSIIEYVNNGIFNSVCIAIGYNNLSIKEKIYAWLTNNNISICGFIHDSCYVDFTSNIHYSAILYPRTLIDQRVVIEENVIVNLNVTIAHDTLVKTNTFIAPGVVISGFCEIGRNCFIGSGTIIKDNIIIADDIFIGAGSVVVNNLKQKGVYFGNPAKKYDK